MIETIGSSAMRLFDYEHEHKHEHDDPLEQLQGSFYCVTTVPICTTSKFEPFTPLMAPRSLSLQRGSGAPLMYQLLPLSATNMP